MAASSATSSATPASTQAAPWTTTLPADPSTATSAPTKTEPTGIPKQTIPPVAGANVVQIVAQWIPYGDQRRSQMADYARRHYGSTSATLAPRVIVVHFTESDTWQSAYSTFSQNVANRGEFPGTCAHFVLDQSGVAHQLVPLDLMCRHTIGLNHVAIGIEVVQATHGNSSSWAEQQILGRPAQAQALVALIRQLQGRYGIATTDVIGHAEANRHRLFTDLLGWRNDHTDWSMASMTTLRSRL